MNKILERIYIEWFVKQKKWKDCSIIDFEKPDFILDLNGKKLGFEVTNIFKDEGKKGSPQKKNEAHNYKWLKDLSTQYYMASNIPIKLQILLNEDGSLPEPSDLINDIVNNLPNNSLGLSEFETYMQKNLKIKIFTKRLPEEFSNYNRWSFVNSHIGMPREITKDLLKKKIESKIIKSKKYAKNLDEMNLLIVVDPSYDSGMFYMPEVAFNLPCNNFDGIFLAIHHVEIHKIA